MSSGDGIQLLILVLLLLMSAFFSSTETALTTVNKIRVRTLAENGDKQAEYVLKIIEDPSKMLSAILIGNNVVNCMRLLLRRFLPPTSGVTRS